MELRQALQTGQFVQHEPDRMLAFLRLIQEAQNQQINRMPPGKSILFVGFER
jgi:hypothetical protein